MSTNQNNVIVNTNTIGLASNALNPIVWQNIFLDTYRETLSIAKAASTAGVSRPTVYKYLRIDQDFAQQFEDAKKDALDDLKESAFERAKKGSLAVRATFDKQGNVTSKSTETKYETPLTIKFLEALEPEVFRPPTRLEHTGANGGPIEIQETKRAQLTLAVQNGINSGMSLQETLNFFIMRGIPQEDLQLVQGSDLQFPETSNAIDVTCENDNNDS